MIHNQLRLSCQRLQVFFKPSDPEPSPPPAASMLRVVLFKLYEINLSLFVISWKSTVQSPLRLMLDPDTNKTRTVLLHQRFLPKLSGKLYITSLISALEEEYIETWVRHADSGYWLWEYPRFTPLSTTDLRIAFGVLELFLYLNSLIANLELLSIL